METEIESGHKSGFVSLCREIIKRFIENNFPTTIQGKVSYVLLQSGKSEDFGFLCCLLNQLNFV